MEDDDARVRFVGDERAIPPTVGSCFNECTHIVVISTGNITVRLRCYKDGIKCEEWIGRYYFFAQLNPIIYISNVD